MFVVSPRGMGDGEEGLVCLADGGEGYVRGSEDGVGDGGGIDLLELNMMIYTCFFFSEGLSPGLWGGEMECFVGKIYGNRLFFWYRAGEEEIFSDGSR